MPTASELVDRLVEAQLADREVNPGDRRQVLVGLTPQAGRIATEMATLQHTQLRSALARLAPAERPMFIRSLEVLVEALRPDAPPPDVVVSDQRELVPAS